MSNNKKTQMIRVSREFAGFIKSMCEKYNNEIRLNRAKSQNIPLNKIPKITYGEMTNEIHKLIQAQKKYWIWT
jgi:16S rRNA U516 pseudouridylate synthase RsuA-like enzyme